MIGFLSAAAKNGRYAARLSRLAHICRFYVLLECIKVLIH